MAFLDHVVKLVTLFGVRTRDSIVCKYASHHPFRVLGDALSVMFDLSFIAGGLLIAVSTDAAVRCNSELCFSAFLMLFPTCLFAGMTITFPINSPRFQSGCKYTRPALLGYQIVS